MLAIKATYQKIRGKKIKKKKPQKKTKKTLLLIANNRIHYLLLFEKLLGESNKKG
jgi:hypothetical protein